MLSFTFERVSSTHAQNKRSTSGPGGIDCFITYPISSRILDRRRDKSLFVVFFGLAGGGADGVGVGQIGIGRRGGKVEIVEIGGKLIAWGIISDGLISCASIFGESPEN